MPPELKKPITSIDEMTCENCVFSEHHWQEQKNPKAHYCRLHLLDQKDDFAQVTTSDLFCSEGQWLWFGNYLHEYGIDEEPKIHVCEYEELYQEFARQQGGSR